MSLLFFRKQTTDDENVAAAETGDAGGPYMLERDIALAAAIARRESLIIQIIRAERRRAERIAEATERDKYIHTPQDAINALATIDAIYADDERAPVALRAALQKQSAEIIQLINARIADAAERAEAAKAETERQERARRRARQAETTAKERRERETQGIFTYAERGNFRYITPDLGPELVVADGELQKLDRRPELGDRVSFDVTELGGRAVAYNLRLVASAVDVVEQALGRSRKS